MTEAIILKVVLTFIPAVIGWIANGLKNAADKKKESAAKTAAQKAVDLSVMAVMDLTDTFRKRTEDGTLTKEDKIVLKQSAIAKAIDLASGDAGTYLVKIGADAIGDLVEASLAKLKAKRAG